MLFRKQIPLYKLGKLSIIFLSILFSVLFITIQEGFAYQSTESTGIHDEVVVLLTEKTRSAKNIKPTLKGTFIQDFLVKDWDDQRWQKEFSILQELGMDYLIFAPSVLIDNKGRVKTLYRSETIEGVGVNRKDYIDICLRNAEQANFKVFIGLNFNEGWWEAPYSKDWLDNEMEMGNIILEELVSKYKSLYPSALYGWYWVWEVDNLHSKSVGSKDALVSALNINVDFINDRTPEMPLLLSPFMNSKLGTAKEYKETWEYVLPKVRFKKGDVFAPQDCVGAGGLQEFEVDEWFRELGEAVKTNKNLVFWANVETFNQANWTSRTIDKIIDQMNTVDSYVDKIISFAYSHYYSPQTVISQFHKVYKSYLDHGSLPALPTPQKVSDIELYSLKNGTLIKWKDQLIADEITGYRVYSDGNLIAEVQRPDSKVKLDINDVEIAKGSHYIVAYNAVGKESEKVFLKNINLNN